MGVKISWEKSWWNLQVADCVFLCVCSLLSLSLKCPQKPGLPFHQIASFGPGYKKKKKTIEKYNNIWVKSDLTLIFVPTQSAYLWLAWPTRWWQISIRVPSTRWLPPGWRLVRAPFSFWGPPWGRLVRVWGVSLQGPFPRGRRIRVWIMSILTLLSHRWPMRIRWAFFT